MRGLKYVLLVLAGALLLPSVAAAQGTLTGTIRDGSGAVLPGVTVEAASPALTERSRTGGLRWGRPVYRIIELPPGTYSLTFTLPGFSTFKRDGLELAGSAVLTIPAEMKVGAIEETVTVTGETPVVDVQSVRRETVISKTSFPRSLRRARWAPCSTRRPVITVDGNGVAGDADDDLLQRRAAARPTRAA
jgi:hypothetical protein